MKENEEKTSSEEGMEENELSEQVHYLQTIESIEIHHDQQMKRMGRVEEEDERRIQR